MVWSAAHQLKDSPPNLRKGLWPSVPPLHLCARALKARLAPCELGGSSGADEGQREDCRD